MSQILRTTTDLEALDAAIQLAGMVLWFDDEINVDSTYNLIVSTFRACFDSTRKLQPGLRDRVYYSGWAMILIRRMLFSSRLRRIIIRFVEFVSYEGFEEVVSPYHYRGYRW